MIYHRLGIDVDGVLANFREAYNAYYVALTGKDLFQGPPLEWDYDLAAGYTREHRKEVWRQIAASKDFWVRLNALPGAVTFLEGLRRLERDLPVDVYFLTNRCGTAKGQTEKWLEQHGYRRPTVLVTVEGHKGHLARALNLTALLDDKPSNLADLPETCKGVLLRATYNTHAWNVYEGIDFLHEFFDKGLTRV